VTVRELMAKHPHFGRLSSDDLDSLVAALDVRDFPDGHVFTREGAHTDAVFVVIAGDVEVARDRSGVHHELNHMREGELFGLIALVGHAHRAATCRARGACTVGTWAGPVAHLLFNQCAAIAHAFQLALATQLAKDFRHIEQRVRSAL
jgi:CRP-like cAMP-binding protein